MPRKLKLYKNGLIENVFPRFYIKRKFRFLGK